MRTSIVLVFLTAVVAACGPIRAPQPAASPLPKPNATEPAATPNEPVRKVEAAAISQLAGNLGLRPADISVASNEPVQFANACLGVEMPDVPCAQAVTPGRIIMLEAQGISFEYYTSEDGARVQPASRALTWQREGGIAGFCDRLVLFRSGEVYGYPCASEGQMGTVAALLSPREREQFGGWVRQFGRVQIDASDPKGVADRMVVLLNFEGVGSIESGSAAEEEELLQFAASLYGRLFNQATPQ